MRDLNYLLKKLKELRQKERLKKSISVGKYRDTDNQLNFIISPGRSGTTFLRKILLENTNLHIPPESGEFIQVVLKGYNQNTKWKDKVDQAIEIFIALNLNEFWKLDINKLSAYIHAVPIDSQNLKSLLFSFYRFHADTYNSEANILADKSPYLSQDLEWLKIVYPNSKYLFLFRNPLEVTESRMFYFKENIELASNKWIWAANEYHKYNDRLNTKLIFYEDFIATQNTVFQEICDFLVLEKREGTTEIHMGDDNLLHHKNLFNKNYRNRITNFSSSELDYLNSKFQKVKSWEIKKYYNI